MLYEFEPWLGLKVMTYGLADLIFYANQTSPHHPPPTHPFVWLDTLGYVLWQWLLPLVQLVGHGADQLCREKHSCHTGITEHGRYAGNTYVKQGLLNMKGMLATLMSQWDYWTWKVCWQHLCHSGITEHGRYAGNTYVTQGLLNMVGMLATLMSHRDYWTWKVCWQHASLILVYFRLITMRYISLAEGTLLIISHNLALKWCLLHFIMKNVVFWDNELCSSTYDLHCRHKWEKMWKCWCTTEDW